MQKLSAERAGYQAMGGGRMGKQNARNILLVALHPCQRISLFLRLLDGEDPVRKWLRGWRSTSGRRVGCDGCDPEIRTQESSTAFTHSGVT